jgi:hypothetical protein
MEGRLIGVLPFFFHGGFFDNLEAGFPEDVLIFFLLVLLVASQLGLTDTLELPQFADLNPADFGESLDAPWPFNILELSVVLKVVVVKLLVVNLIVHDLLYENIDVLHLSEGEPLKHAEAFS